MINVIIDLTELDIEIFKAMVLNQSGADDYVSWTYPSEETGEYVKITFRKEPDEQ